jgi:type III restriction enzyme
MSFFEKPILNSPYAMPKKHWELDDDGRPTDSVFERRRRSAHISAMPAAKSKKKVQQDEMELSTAGLEGQDVSYNVTEFVNELRQEVDVWRALPNPAQWQVSPITQQLLQHWRGSYDVELNPVYVDVAVERWQQFTGENAVLVGAGETFADLKASRLRI